MNSTLHNGTYRTRYLFNGKELDTETNLYYYGARYFEPQIMTWYGVDPLTEKYPFTSSYVYCNGNPVKYIDPDGREKHIFFDTKRRRCTTFEEIKKEQKRIDDNKALERRSNQYEDDADYIHVFAHGSKKAISISYKHNNHTVNTNISDPSSLFNLLLNNGQLMHKNNNNVFVLHSCHTGEGGDSFAQKMSGSDAFWGSAFIAPSDILVSTDSWLFGRNEYVKNNGVWRVFYKGKEIPELAMSGAESPWYKKSLV